jgi:hypothetical protein
VKRTSSDSILVASAGQSRPVFPVADRGLTIAAVRAFID